MKKILLLSLTSLVFTTCLVLTAKHEVSAASSSPSAQATSSAKTAIPSNKAKDLLERVATKVAELSAKGKRAYQGQVKSLQAPNFTLATPDGDKRITTNDATDFYRIRAGNRSEIAFGSIKTGDELVAVGIVDPDTGDLAARQVIVKIERKIFAGKIASIDKNSIASIKTSDKEEIKVDLSDAAFLKKTSDDGKILTAKLADFKEGSTVFVVAHSLDSKTNIYSSLKALVMTKPQ